MSTYMMNFTKFICKGNFKFQCFRMKPPLVPTHFGLCKINENNPMMNEFRMNEMTWKTTLFICGLMASSNNKILGLNLTTWLCVCVCVCVCVCFSFWFHSNQNFDFLGWKDVKFLYWVPTCNKKCEGYLTF
jgi:hypothetical protein